MLTLRKTLQKSEQRDYRSNLLLESVSGRRQLVMPPLHLRTIPSVTEQYGFDSEDETESWDDIGQRELTNGGSVACSNVLKDQEDDASSVVSFQSCQTWSRVSEASCRSFRSVLLAPGQDFGDLHSPKEVGAEAAERQGTECGREVTPSSIVDIRPAQGASSLLQPTNGRTGALPQSPHEYWKWHLGSLPQTLALQRKTNR